MADARQPSHVANTPYNNRLGVLTPETFAHLPILGSLPVAELEWLAGHISCLRLKSGQTLFRQGEEAGNLFYLKRGSVKIYRSLHSGQKKVMEIVNAGSFLALSPLFIPRCSYPETAETLVNSDLLQFERTPLLRALQCHPSICLQLLEHMSRRLEQKKQEIALLAEKSAGSRLLQLLVEDIPERMEKNGQFNIQASKRDIASRIAVKPETLSRLLKKMDASGVLRNTSRGIVVTDVAELRKQASRI